MEREAFLLDCETLKGKSKLESLVSDFYLKLETSENGQIGTIIVPPWGCGGCCTPAEREETTFLSNRA